MSNEQQRYDISDKVWDLLKPHHTCLDSEGSGAELRRIIGGLSMACFGFYAQEPHGGTYRRAMGNRVLCISGSADGGTKVSGNSY